MSKSKQKEYEFAQTHRLHKKSRECSVCLTKTKYICRCGIRFCGWKCKEASIHAFVCGIHRADRMKKYVGDSVKNLRDTIGLSFMPNGYGPYVSLSYNSHDRYVSFWKPNAFPGTYYCALCGIHLGGFPHFNGEHFKIGNIIIGYHTCESCSRKGNNILEDSFLTLRETRLYLLLCIRRRGYRLCKDMRRYLWSVVERELVK